MKPIFIAGPHGSGKTTLISKLIVKSDRFIKDDYEIDFSNDMETLSSMTIFEKCLIRLYHRFYTAELAIKKCGMSKENDKILVVDRSIYDSLVYIEVTKDSQMIVDTTIYESEKIHDNHFRIKLKDVNTQLGATLNKFVTEYDIKDVLIKEPEISEIVYNIYEGKVELKK